MKWYYTVHQLNSVFDKVIKIMKIIEKKYKMIWTGKESGLCHNVSNRHKILWNCIIYCIVSEKRYHRKNGQDIVTMKIIAIISMTIF